jgi:hypothetical protein
MNPQDDVDYDDWFTDERPRRNTSKFNKERFCKRNKIGKNKYGSHKYVDGNCIRCDKIDPKRKRNKFKENNNGDST